MRFHYSRDCNSVFAQSWYFIQVMTYGEVSILGRKYFGINFDKLVKVKTMIDPDNPCTFVRHVIRTMFLMGYIVVWTLVQFKFATSIVYFLKSI